MQSKNRLFSIVSSDNIYVPTHGSISQLKAQHTVSGTMSKMLYLLRFIRHRPSLDGFGVGILTVGGEFSHHFAAAVLRRPQLAG